MGENEKKPDEGAQGEDGLLRESEVSSADRLDDRVRESDEELPGDSD